MCALIYIECTTLDLLQYGLCQVQCESRKISDLQWRQPEVYGHEFGFHPRVPKKYLDPSLVFLRERMVVVQRKIKRSKGSLKETQSWVWQKGVIPHEEKNVTKDLFVLSDWLSRTFFTSRGNDLAQLSCFLGTYAACACSLIVLCSLLSLSGVYYFCFPF